MSLQAHLDPCTVLTSFFPKQLHPKRLQGTGDVFFLLSRALTMVIQAGHAGQFGPRIAATPEPLIDRVPILRPLQFRQHRQSSAEYSLKRALAALTSSIPIKSRERWSCDGCFPGGLRRSHRPFIYDSHASAA